MDSDFPLVSIVMPVYNVQKYLHDTLESILAQELESWELIAIDDFSTDQSLSILKSYAEKDQRIRVYSNTKQGIIPALQMAFDHSKGKMITRMDADDLMPSYKLKVLLQELNKEGSGNIVTGEVSYFTNGILGEGYIKYQNWLNGINRSQQYWNNIYKECVIPSACWIAYKSDLNTINAFHNSQYPEDYDLIFKFYQSGMRIRGMNMVLHYWRDHSSRASRNDPNYADQHFFELKIGYFLQLDYDKRRQLFLWGAGKKGKQIAKLLIRNEIFFTWITDNENKVERDIYGKHLISSKELGNHTDRQVIIAISDKGFELEKRKLFDQYGLNAESIFNF